MFIRLASLSLALFPLLTACTGSSVPDQPDPEPPTCTDGVRNGTETDIDCGGTCGVCDVGAGCETGADCIDGVCDGGACQMAACDDGVFNGDESDIDCGGDECATCDAGDTCNSASDCADGVCDGGVCQAATCNDGVVNGTETDLDCGGDSCAPCTRGQECAQPSDCADSICFDETNTCERVLYIRGTGVLKDGAVEQFPDQDLFRVDFESQPTVTNFDGSPLALPVSDGTFVTSSVSDPLRTSELSVAGTDMAGSTGRIYYQSIAPTYYGMVMGAQDSAAVTRNYNALVVQRLEGKEIEIRLIDTTP